MQRMSTYLKMFPPNYAKFVDFCIDEWNVKVAHFEIINKFINASQHCWDLLMRYSLFYAQFPKHTLTINHFKFLKAIFKFSFVVFCN
jgi:hypothetical protein